MVLQTQLGKGVVSQIAASGPFLIIHGLSDVAGYKNRGKKMVAMTRLKGEPLASWIEEPSA